MADDFLKRIARGFSAARSVMGSDLVAESLPVAIGKGLAKPVIERRKRRSDGAERYVLVLPFGEGETRVELTPQAYEALTREMIRFWNAQVAPQAPSALEPPTQD